MLVRRLAAVALIVLGVALQIRLDLGPRVTVDERGHRESCVIYIQSGESSAWCWNGPIGHALALWYFPPWGRQ